MHLFHAYTSTTLVSFSLYCYAYIHRWCSNYWVFCFVFIFLPYVKLISLNIQLHIVLAMVSSKHLEWTNSHNPIYVIWIGIPHRKTWCVTTWCEWCIKQQQWRKYSSCFHHNYGPVVCISSTNDDHGDGIFWTK